MSLPTIEELRKLTSEALEQARIEREQKLARIQERDERKAKENQAFAERVLAQVPDKARKEAKEGRGHVVVMGLKWGRDHDGYSSNQLQYNQLKGPGAIVWNELSKAGLQPSIEYWHDGVGMDGGFNIIIKWAEPEKKTATPKRKS